MYQLVKALLFQLDPERAHHFTFSFLKIPGFARLARSGPKDDPKLARDVFGLHFKNPIGLAAGLDKNAIAFEQLGIMGFGFVEIGTVTPRPQPGNDKPRLFRLPKDAALINRMGFNNDGAEAVAKRLSKRRNKGLIVGGNIGKNKDTSNDKAAEDYLICFDALFDYVDYFVVNVSSPNTPNLRDLQEKRPLTDLLLQLQHRNNTKTPPKPILLKIAPDLTYTQLDDIIDIVKITGIAGVIATNTTISRSGLSTAVEKVKAMGNGGLSGKPLNKRSTEVIRYLKTKSRNTFPVIGVGGIHNAEDALEKLDAGADLLQLYTGFIYEGPGLISAINKKILERK
jgi:dihydroorotate dehydrogenase